MSSKTELMNALEILESHINSNIQEVEDAFELLEVEAKTWDDKRRDLLRKGAEPVLRSLRTQEQIPLFFAKLT